MSRQQRSTHTAKCENCGLIIRALTAAELQRKYADHKETHLIGWFDIDALIAGKDPFVRK